MTDRKYGHGWWSPRKFSSHDSEGWKGLRGKQIRENESGRTPLRTSCRPPQRAPVFAVDPPVLSAAGPFFLSFGTRSFPFPIDAVRLR